MVSYGYLSFSDLKAKIKKIKKKNTQTHSLKTIPCPKPFKSFLLIQTPISFTDPSISSNSLSNHPFYVEGHSNHPSVCCSCYPSLPLVSKFCLHLKTYNWLFRKHPGSPGAVWLVWTSHLAALLVSLLLHFPPLMPVRDTCPSLGRAGYEGKKRTQHVLITTSVLSKTKCLTKRSLNVCKTEFNKNVYFYFRGR